MGGLTTRQLETRRLRGKRQGRTQLNPGDTLQDRYEVIGVAGVGGFSTVYKARDRRFANVTRLCAIKEMVINTNDPELREMTIKSFEREANILATLEHPAIPDVYDYFTQDDRSYLVLEFIRGKDLEAVLGESDEPLPQKDVLKWSLQVCDVLQYLHTHQPQPIMFRDVKPSNIMLDVYDRVHLIDFNIAKVFRGEEKHTMVGTEGYSPPEQYRGESSPAGDIYSLGASLHHLLTKQDPRMEVPFSFKERDISTRNPSVTPDFEAVIMRCLEYNTIDRYSDANILRNALEVIGKPNVTIPSKSMPTATMPAFSQGAGQSVPNTIGANQGSVQPIWKFKCEDEVRSSPLVANGMLYVGAYDNNLYALHSHSGEFAWKFPAEGGIAGRPTEYKGSIYIGSADNHLYALKGRTGHLNWKFETEKPIYSSPMAKFDHVFFGSDDGHLYAVSVSSGRQAWRADAHEPVRSSVAIGEDAVYFGSEGGVLFAVDLAGRTKWQFQARRAITSTPYLFDDLVIVGSQDNTVYAIDANSGWAIWRFRTNRPIVSSPVVDDGTVYIGSADGHLYAIDLNSGRQKWTYKTKGQVASSPAILDERVYFGSTDGDVYCLDVKKGTVQWQFKTGNMVVSSPAIMDGVVYIGSADRHVYALPA
jgi:outer membrane protein assembly factor BamB/tRNA A-37 threonylcarbamoyl transferase component Bud32